MSRIKQIIFRQREDLTSYWVIQCFRISFNWNANESIEWMNYNFNYSYNVLQIISLNMFKNQTFMCNSLDRRLARLTSDWLQCQWFNYYTWVKLAIKRLEQWMIYLPRLSSGMSAYNNNDPYSIMFCWALGHQDTLHFVLAMHDQIIDPL